MKKLLTFVIIIISINAAAYALTYCDMAGDSLAAWKVQAEYKEKYFQYDTFYNYGFETQDVLLRGVNQDFLFRLGMPDGYFASLDASYVFQNLQGLYDYNNVQTITLLAGKRSDAGLGIMLGLKVPLGSKIADDYRLINNNDMYDIVAGYFQKSSFWLLKYSLQAVVEQPIRSADYQGSMDLSASLGFNFYNEPDKQVIDFVTEVEYYAVQRGPKLFPGNTQMDSGNSFRLTVIPQLVLKFYNDFNLVLGAEILATADNWFLNKTTVPVYVVKMNYVLNGARQSSPNAFIQPQMTPQGMAVSLTGTPSSVTTTTGIIR